jgi:hypothetical protein
VTKNVIYVLLLISNISNAYMSGDGSAELGLSVEKQKTTMGLAGDYDLSSSGSQLTTHINSEFKLGANLGVSRADEAITESNYQYEQSLIRFNGEIDYQFDHRSVDWHNAFNTEILFPQENENVNWDINDAEKTWSVTSGPSLMLGKQTSLAMTVEVLMSYRSELELDSAEESYNLTISKLLSPLTVVDMNGKNVCTHNQGQESQIPCRKEYNVRLLKTNKHSELLLERGITTIDSSDVNLYLVSFNYDMNSYSHLAFLHRRSVDTIADQENIILGNINGVSQRVISTRSINYSIDEGQVRIDLGFVTQKVFVESDSTNSSITSARMAYPMDARLCSLCNLNVGYEHSNFNEERIQKVTTLSVVKYNTRQVSTALKFSRSTVENEFDVWSMNLSISYNGLLEKMGAR